MLPTHTPQGHERTILSFEASQLHYYDAPIIFILFQYFDGNSSLMLCWYCTVPVENQQYQEQEDTFLQ